MIDKSIRQYYENGKEVGPVTKGMKMIWDPIKQKYFPQDETGLDERQLLKNVAGSAVKNIATRKLATQLGGTGILSSLGPIGMIIAMMLARKGIGKGQEYLTQKLTKGGVEQAFQAGFGSPEEQRELRQLEKRRDYMLHRRDVLGKKISEKNLEEVTNRINTIKKTAPVTVTDYEGEAYGTPDTIKDILDKQYEHEDKKTAPLRTTPIIDYESEAYGTETIADIQAKQKAEAERAMQETVRQAELQAEVTRQAEANAARIRAEQARAAGPHGNGGGGHHGHTETRSSSGWESSPFNKGGRVDKALGGRVRDI